MIIEGFQNLTGGIRNLETQAALLPHLIKRAQGQKKVSEGEITVYSRELTLSDKYLFPMFGHESDRMKRVQGAKLDAATHQATLDNYSRLASKLKPKAVEMILDHLDSVDDPLYAVLHDISFEAYEASLAIRNYLVLLEAARKFGDGIDPGMRMTGNVLKAQEYFERGNDLDTLADLRGAMRVVDRKMLHYEMCLKEAVVRLGKIELDETLDLKLDYVNLPRKHNVVMGPRFRHTLAYAQMNMPRNIHDVLRVHETMLELDDLIKRHYVRSIGNMDKYVARIFSEASSQGRPKHDIDPAWVTQQWKEVKSI